jgi:hypothetical protein
LTGISASAAAARKPSSRNLSFRRGSHSAETLKNEFEHGLDGPDGQERTKGEKTKL